MKKNYFMLVSLCFLLFQASCSSNKLGNCEKGVDSRSSIAVIQNGNRLEMKDFNPSDFFILKDKNRYEKYGSCKNLEGVANFAITFESGVFTGWESARTSVVFKIKDKNTGTIYDCSGFISANITKSGAAYLSKDKDGKSYWVQNYNLTVNITIAGAGTILNDSVICTTEGRKPANL